jgi:hypothetical protein
MRIEKKLLEGKMHMVVPVVMIRVGTWAGSGGPVHYDAQVLEKSAKYWDGRPVVIYHPDMFGSEMAARPEIFNQQKVGVLFGTTFVDGKLKAEAWLDPERLQAVDARVYDALQKGTPVAVSTGLSGFYDGEKTPDGAIVLSGIAPDHLAILPDQRGACSLADGAGLLKNVGGYFDEELLPLPSTV